MLNLIRQIKYKKSNYEGGGLHQTRRLSTDQNTLFKASQFKAPRRLDFRDMCIQTSNQLKTPHCAGYSTAGMIEVKNWRSKHYPEQIDGDAIYTEAKKLDGNNTDGTSLDSAAQAAINLKLITGDLKFVSNDVETIKFAVHSHDTFVAGFMITEEWNMVNKKTGAIIDLGPNAEKRGGHAVLVCGYCPEGVYIQNSWGQNWGIWGFALIPWEKVSQQYMYGMVIV